MPPANPTPANPTPAHATVPATTRAVVQRRYGGPEQLELAEMPTPAPGDGQVLLEVEAAAIDRGTWHLMTGLPLVVRLGFGFRGPRQPVPGLDVVGTVVALGPGVSDLRVGDRVFGVADGSFATHAVADAHRLAVLPAGVDPLVAAAVPVSGGTAIQAVVDQGRVAPGQRVLVLGASGGVGSFAVQVAAARGAIVTGTASTAKVAQVRTLGVPTVVDHTTTDPLAQPRAYDCIIDTGGRNPLRRLRRALTPDGTLVVVGGEGGGRVTGGFGRQLRAAALSPLVRQRLLMLFARDTREVVERLGAMLVEGTLTPVVDRVVALDGVADGLRALAAGEVTGKVVVRVR